MRHLRSIAMGLGIAILSVSIVLGSSSLSMLEGTLGKVSPSQIEPSQTMVSTKLAPTNTPISLSIVTPTETSTLPPTPASCPPPAGWIPITVQPNENLASLSKMYQIAIEQLIQANCLTTGEPDPGVRLYVPPLPTATLIPCGPPSSWIIYIVKPKDNLYHISTLYQTTVPQLQAANCLGNSTLIITGQKLYVPNVATITPTISTTLSAPVLLLEKTSTTTSFSTTGKVIDYNYNLKNTGTVTLSGPFTVSDNKTTVTCPATASLAVGASINCTASYTTTQNDLDTGSISNTASGHASYNGNTVNSNQSSLSIPATQTSSLTLDKSSTTASYVLAGDSITYTYNLKNTGNVTLVGPFTVSDDKTAVTCPATTSLAPNTSINCTAIYTVTQTDVDSGSVTNIATGHAVFKGNAVHSNQDSLTISATIPVGTLLVISLFPI